MTNKNQFHWVDFYKEFASKLLQYKDNRKELVKKVLEIYKRTGTATVFISELDFREISRTFI